MDRSDAALRPGTIRRYVRDRHGRVEKAEFNRRLPHMECAVCHTWIDAGAEHTLADCKRRVKVDG